MSNNNPPIDWPALLESLVDLPTETAEYIKKLSTEFVVDGTNKIIDNTLKIAQGMNIGTILKNVVGESSSKKYNDITEKFDKLETTLKELEKDPLSEEYQKLKLKIETLKKDFEDEIGKTLYKAGINSAPVVGPGIASAITSTEKSIEVLDKKVDGVFNEIVESAPVKDNVTKPVTDNVTKPVKDNETKPVTDNTKTGGSLRSNSKNKTQKRRLSITIKKIKKLKEKINKTIKLFQRTNIII